MSTPDSPKIDTRLHAINDSLDSRTRKSIADLGPARELALTSRGVPAHLACQRFEGELPHVPGQDLANWSGGPKAWAVALYGVPGAGKSMLAAQLMWLRLPSVDTAAWWRASRLIDAHFSLPDVAARARVCQECYADLLVIDDISSMGRRGLDILCNVIGARRDEGLATILTFNVPLAALCKRYPKLGSKLTSGTIAVPFEQTYEERTGLCN